MFIICPSGVISSERRAFTIDRQEDMRMAIEMKPGHIHWLNSLDEALIEAKKTGKVVLLDFFNPG
jgi:hypothetical protein